MIYIVTCDKIRFFKTFDSLDSIINFLTELNKTEFDGGIFSLFGRGLKQDWVGDDLEWVDDDYYTDSVVLCNKGNIKEYFTFIIRCINSKGEQIELDV